MASATTSVSHEDLMLMLARFADGDREMLPAPQAVRKAVEVYGFWNKNWRQEYTRVRPCHVGKAVIVNNGRESRICFLPCFRGLFTRHLLWAGVEIVSVSGGGQLLAPYKRYKAYSESLYEDAQKFSTGRYIADQIRRSTRVSASGHCYPHENFLAHLYQDRKWPEILSLLWVEGH